MIYLLLWMWFVGAFMVWEEARDNVSTRPDPRFPFYSEEARDFHDAHPELHSTMYVAIQLVTVVFWPIVMSYEIAAVCYRRLKSAS